MAGIRSAAGSRVMLLAALLVPPGLCAALIPARSSFPSSGAALLLVALTVATAALGTRAAGYLAAVSGAIWLDFFLILPYYTLTITRREDAETTVLLLAVGVAVTEILELARRRGRTVAADEAQLAMVQSTAALVAAGEAGPAVARQVEVQLSALLGLRGCRFAPPADPASRAPVARPADGRGGGPRIEPDGSVAWGPAHWDLAEHGFPDARVRLDARYAGRVHGGFVLEPVPGTAPALATRRTAVVLADLAGAALARRPDEAPAPAAPAEA